MGFIIRFILISIAITWLFRLVVGYFSKSFFNNIQQGQNRSGKSTGQEGKMNINKKPEFDKKINKNVGEYIDYEEIK